MYLDIFANYRTRDGRGSVPTHKHIFRTNYSGMSTTLYIRSTLTTVLQCNTYTNSKMAISWGNCVDEWRCRKCVRRP